MLAKKIINKYRLPTIILVGYLAIYFVNSISGSYAISPTGKINYSFGMSVMDRVQWDPEFGCIRLTGSQSFFADPLGLLFLPLIVVDRLVWHRDINYFDTHG